MYQALSDKGHRSTSAAPASSANEALYDRILNPFGQEYPMTAWPMWRRKNGTARRSLCAGQQSHVPMSEEAFGIDEAATVGDFTVALFTLAGMPTSAEEGMMILAQLGVLSAEDKADTVLTRERLADTLCSFLSKAAGQDIQTGLNPLPDLTDADQISPASLTNVQFMLHHGLLRVADSTLQPQAPRPGRIWLMPSGVWIKWNKICSHPPASLRFQRIPCWRVLEQITPSWRTKQRRFCLWQGRASARCADEASRRPMSHGDFSEPRGVEIDYGELRLVNAGVAALRQVNSDTARGKRQVCTTPR